MSADDKIRETVQAQEGFFQWFAQAWREKNWLRLLLISEAVFLILLNPKTSAWALATIGVQLPGLYTFVWLAICALIFIGAAVVALRTRITPKLVSIDERRTIKGLRPFHFGDAEIFDDLQRTEIIRECASAIADTQFRFGVLSGQSGSGKTSFLQAGLWPTLTRNQHHCVYVKFTEIEPLETLKTALAEGNVLPPESSENSSVAQLLDACDLSGGTSLVLFFDQFEQFFLQNKRTKDRQPFIAGLAEWYRTRSNRAIKILVCIRSDFSDRLIELQKVMRYSLGPQENFRLAKFDPQQAAAVLRVIAQTEGITIDDAFVEELATQQLASSEDGLISPVDIQILAWMVAGESAAEDRAFNRMAYDALGGIEGLLEKFLKRALSARETPLRHRAALNVLLALTDFDSDSRAGTLTLEQLSEKLENEFTTADLEEATSWLARSDVRLITPNQQGSVVAYELAHERLIPALRRLAAKELSEVDVARRLMERKVNEWTANNQRFRYLLRGRELKLIRRHRAQLLRNPQKAAKAKFLSRSLVLRNLKLSAACLTLLAAGSFPVWWFSASGQIWQVERDLANLTTSVNDPDTLYRVAKNLLSADKLDQVRELAALLIGSHEIEILSELQNRYEKLGAQAKAQEIRKQLEAERGTLLLSSQINIPIAIAYSKIGDTSRASRLIEEVARAFDETSNMRLYSLSGEQAPPRRPPGVILSFAQAYHDIGDSKRSAEELFLVLNTAPSNLKTDPSILIDAALLCEKLGPGYCDSEAWERIFNSGETLPPLNYVSLLNIAGRAYSGIGETKKAEEILERAGAKLSTLGLKTPGTPPPPPLRYAWGELSALEVIGFRGLTITGFRRPLKFLDSELPGGNQLDVKSRSLIFRAAGQAYINIAMATRDVSFLDRADVSIEWLERKDTPDLYLNLASAYLDFGQPEKALYALRRVCLVADSQERHDEWQKLADLIYSAYEKVPEGIRQNVGSDPRDEFGLDSVSTTWLLSLEAQRLWSNGQQAEARNRLAIAEEIPATIYGNNVLVLLANTCTLMRETDKASRYLERILEYAARLPPDAKAEAMCTISDAYAKNKEWRRARQAAEQTGNDAAKAVALSNILKIWKESN